MVILVFIMFWRCWGREIEGTIILDYNRQGHTALPFCISLVALFSEKRALKGPETLGKWVKMLSVTACHAGGRE